MSISYFGLVVVSLILGLATQGYIQRQYKKWSRVPSPGGKSGAEVAEQMLADAGATEIGITPIAGTLTDNFDPRDMKLHLSRENLEGGSVASVAVACHEAGHAIQAHTGFALMKVRSALVPVVNFASNIWMIVFIIGVSLNSLGFVRFAVILFAATVLFQLVTLPVEIDASRRAVAYIERCGMGEQATAGARSVLIAAALTYLAAALVSVLQLLYIASSAQDRG